MQNFKMAVLAYGESIKVFRTTRKDTSRKKHVPKETLEQFKSLITFEDGTYEYTLTLAFRAECAKAEAAAAALPAART